MRNFTTEDFNGSGQYIIRADKEAGQYVEPGFMSTILYKVGYCLGQGCINPPDEGNITTLVSMSDGMTKLGYFNTLNDPNWQPDMNPKGPANTDKWIWVPFNSKQIFCNYLNNSDFSQEYRFATQEEVVKVIEYQKSRCKG